MRLKNYIILISTICTSLFISSHVLGQVTNWDEERRGAVYLSIGYGINSYANSTIHITQAQSGNSYDMQNVKGDDKGTSSSGFSLAHANFHLGYFFNYNQTSAIELNYDACNYYVTDNQNITLNGAINGANGSQSITFSEKNGYKYGLNGANFLLIDYVRRIKIWRDVTHKYAFDVMGKVGAGPVLPHAVNTLGNNSNSPKSGVYGYCAGAEVALRLTLYRYAYIEVAPKYIYASCNDMDVYEGTAKQTLSTYKLIISIGATIPTSRHNPYFSYGDKHHKVPKGPQPMYRGEDQMYNSHPVPNHHD